MALDALSHAPAALDARGAMPTRAENDADRFRVAAHALAGRRRANNLYADLLLDAPMTAETLLHPGTALEAGDAMSARMENDSDRFRRAHHALSRICVCRTGNAGSLSGRLRRRRLRFRSATHQNVCSATAVFHAKQKKTLQKKNENETASLIVGV
jgi:hypothetical protein